MDLSTSVLSRKRKLAETVQSEKRQQTFTIHKIARFSTDEDLSLRALCLLPRSCLPLACLDLCAENQETSDALFFSVDDGVFEEKIDANRPSGADFLLAEQESSGQCFALEKIIDGVCSAHKVQGWGPNISNWERLSTESQAYKRPATSGASGAEWWHDASVDLKNDPHLDTRSAGLGGKERPAINLKRPHSDARLNISETVEREQKRNVKHEMQQGQSHPTESPLDETPNRDELLRSVRTQYQEALYFSKASLAYFAKGPLSRVRARFQSENSEDLLPLVKYLRSMILSLGVMDKKYRETIPNAIHDIPICSLSDGEGASIIDAALSKRRKSKKDQVGKDGLFPGEEVNVIRWWLNESSSTECNADAERDYKVNSAVFEQRARETKLQIILVLEALALESALISQTHAKPSCVENSCGPNEAPPKTQKTKKPQNLRTLLDLLADRLSIWQSMNSSPSKASAKSCDSKPAAQDATGGKHENLRQFCMDVVVPFYAGRLPEESSSLCQKLGAPKDELNHRPVPVPNSKKSTAAVRPGDPLRRKSPVRQRRTLERVLTDDKSRARKKSIPSLSRSSTEPMLGLKREVSDTSLSSIPLNRVVMTKRYSQREIDLQATSQGSEARFRKKLAVEQELQGAIAALKRPNAREAVREFVEAAEKRQSGVQAKKAKNPIKNPIVREVQIEATPRKPEARKKADFLRLPDPQGKTTLEMANEVEEIPPSSISRVPSTSQKIQNVAILGTLDLKRLESQANFVDQTPTRGSAKYSRRNQCQNALLAEDRSSKHPEQPMPPSIFRLDGRKAQGISSLPAGSSLAVKNTPVTNLAYATPSQELLSFDFGSAETQIGTTPCKNPLRELDNHQLLCSSPPNEGTDLYSALGWTYDADEGL